MADGNIANDGADGRHFAGGVPDGPGGHGDINLVPILAQGQTVILHQGRPRQELPDNQIRTCPSFRRDDHGEGFSDCLIGGVAVDGFRAVVPGEDGAGPRVGDDGFLAALHHLSKKMARLLGRFPLSDVLAEDGYADGFSVDNDGVESQLQGAAVGKGKLLPEGAFGKRTLIERRHESHPLWRGQILGKHPRRGPDVKHALDVPLQCPIECNQAIIEVHRPDQVFGAFDQG